MRIDVIKNYSIAKTNNKIVTNRQVFKGNNDDCFVDGYIKCLTREIYKNPDLYLKEIKNDQHDWRDSFYVAMMLRKEEKEKPYTTNKQKEIKKVITKLEKLRTTILENPENFPQYALDNNRYAIIYAVQELNDIKKNGKDETKIKKWRKIGKIISKKRDFNPNRVLKNGKSLIDIAIENKDKEMATLLMKNKKFIKPEKFEDTESQKLYEDIEKRIQKKGLFSFLGF